MNEFLVFKYFVISSPPKAWEKESPESSFTPLPGRQRAPKTILASSCMLSHFSHIRLCETLQTGARQAPLSVGFSRQGNWSGLPLPSPGDLPDPEIEPTSPALQKGSLPVEPPPGKTIVSSTYC